MMRLTDHLPDLLTPIRDIYVAALLETMAEELNGGAEVDAEPVERDGEGRIHRRGTLDLPQRHDLRVGRNGRALMRKVPGGALLGFDPVSATLSDVTSVSIGPFRWSEVCVRAAKTAGKPNWTPLRRWYLEWFQARFGEESPDLLGVVHGLDGPHQEGGGWRFVIDLGSASPACFAAMLDALSISGCAEITVGEVATAG